MSEEIHHCPICQGLLVEVQSALNRSLLNAFLTGWGSSELQIRLHGGSWMTFMTPSRSAAGLYCAECGSLTLAPTIPSQRRELGLEP